MEGLWTEYRDNQTVWGWKKLHGSENQAIIFTELNALFWIARVCYVIVSLCTSGIYELCFSFLFLNCKLLKDRNIVSVSIITNFFTIFGSALLQCSIKCIKFVWRTSWLTTMTTILLVFTQQWSQYHFYFYSLYSLYIKKVLFLLVEEYCFWLPWGQANNE